MTLLEKLNPAIELAKDMLLAGTLKKNVVSHFTNKGMTVAIATNLMELGEFRASKLSHYKFK